MCPKPIIPFERLPRSRLNSSLVIPVLTLAVHGNNPKPAITSELHAQGEVNLPRSGLNQLRTNFGTEDIDCGGCTDVPGREAEIGMI